MQPTVTFYKPWGDRSWLVNHTAAMYENERPPHIEVCGAPVTSGQTFLLENLHVRGRALLFDVAGCKNLSRPGEPAHFTIGFYPTVEAARDALKRYRHAAE